MLLLARVDEEDDDLMRWRGKVRNIEGGRRGKPSLA